MTKNVRLLRNICFGATALTILVLMAATFIENIFGTDFVSSHIYSSPLFVTLWALVTVSSLLYLIARKMTKRKTVFLLHLSFVVILAGAFTTHIDGIQGYIHLRQGDEPSYIYRTRHGSEGLLPFGIALDDFRLAYYHGTLAPMDFIGSLTIYDDNAVYHGETSMNRIYSYHNYRFNPSTYDSDGKGCTLQLSYDPYGIAITYTGYAILLLAMLLFFFDSHSSFRGLLRHPALRKFTVCAALAAAPYIPAHADGLPPTLPPNIAEKMGNLYIYYNDRVCPLQTLARDFTTKLYGKPSYRGMSAEQVLLGWFFYYNEWKEEPMIRIKSKEVRQMLDMQGKYTSLAGFFDNEGYKLTSAQQEETKAHDLRGIREADEQANLASMAGSGYIFKIFPYRENDSIPPVWLSVSDRLPASMPYEQWLFIRYCMNYMAEHVAKGDFATVDSLIAKTLKYQEKEAHGFLPSDTRFRAEKLYNAMASTSFVAIGCLIIGMAAFAFYCRYFSHGKHKKPSWANRLLVTLMLIALLYILAVMGIEGHCRRALPGFERFRDDAPHGRLLLDIIHDVSPTIRHAAAFRLPAMRFCLTCSNARRSQSAHHTTYAGIIVTAIEHTRRHYYDGLCLICLCHVQRGDSHHHTRHPPLKRRIDRTIVYSEPHHALSGNIFVGNRNLHRCRMGECLMGDAIGAGTPRRYGHSLRCSSTRLHYIRLRCRPYNVTCFSIDLP